MDVKPLQELLKRSNKIVFFGGAGVSTESNIPDFRSSDGLYQKQNSYAFPPETMLSHGFFLTHTKEFYRYYFDQMIHQDAKPNGAHWALAKLESMGKLRTVITQNIDGLHQKAGSKKVLELHGSVERNYCMDCGAFYSLKELLELRDEVPRCARCGGIIKPDVVLYEESLDEETIREAIEELLLSDLLIVGGTSLSVYPAAGFLQYYRGEDLVLINKDRTLYDKKATLLYREPIGQVLAEAIKDLL